MKPCTGCRHLKDMRLIGHGWACDYAPGPPIYGTRINPYTGGRENWYKHQSPAGWNRGWLPDVDWMREAGHPCGPDATLWSPNLRRRLWRWLTGWFQ